MNDLANKIMDIQTKVYNDYGVHSAPLGDKYILMVLSMAEEIIRTVHIEDVTPEIQEIINCNNCHMVSNALDLVLQVRKYDCHEYLENHIILRIQKNILIYQTILLILSLKILNQYTPAAVSGVLSVNYQMVHSLLLKTITTLSEL